MLFVRDVELFVCSLWAPVTFRCYYEFTFQFPCKKALDFDEPAVTYNNRSLGLQKHNKGVKSDNLRDAYLV